MTTTAARRVVFDCYDTLTGSPPRNHRLTAAAVAEGLGIAEVAAKHLVYPLFKQALNPSITVQEPTDDYVRRQVDELGLDVSWQRALSLIGASCGADSGAGQAVADAAEVLSALRARGLEVVLLSNCVLSRTQMLGFLHDAGLAEHLDELYLSSDGVAKKPAPEAFEAASGGRTPEQLVMVGDSRSRDLAVPASLGWATAHADGRPLREVVGAWL